MTAHRRDNLLAFPASPSVPPSGEAEVSAPEVANELPDGAPASEAESDGGAELAVAPPTQNLGADAQAERALVLAAQAGDAAAFAGLVRRHQRRAYAVARAVVLSHDDAEDAVQEGFLHAFRALARFRPEQAFGAWLHRIVANAALDIARRRKVRDADQLPESLASPHRDPAESEELRTRLASALETLGPRQRSVIVLHDVEGYKHAEIGALLGIPEGTARSDLHHART
ncbi:MAG: sigma-70 family RNA polymerase sigma factor, partial [Phycisphaerae bacterium]|nr:sigma-70 family RNA polymerase sigma factor [Gemmatimonadaceae bacterium]